LGLGIECPVGAPADEVMALGTFETGWDWIDLAGGTLRVSGPRDD